MTSKIKIKGAITIWHYAAWSFTFGRTNALRLLHPKTDRLKQVGC